MGYLALLDVNPHGFKAPESYQGHKREPLKGIAGVRPSEGLLHVTANHSMVTNLNSVKEQYGYQL